LYKYIISLDNGYGQQVVANILYNFFMGIYCNTLDFAERLREFILEKEIAVEKLAVFIGISRSTLFRYLQGERVPTIAIAVNLANYFDCSLEFLFGRTTAEKVENFQPDLPAFGERFKFVLNERKITAYGLCKKSKIDASSIHYWLSGNYVPYMDNLFRLADALDCTVDYLIGREL